MLHFNRPPRASPHDQGEIEELIPDPRGALTPAEIVEHKLTALLSHVGLGISDLPGCRCSSRDHGPASSLAGGAAGAATAPTQPRGKDQLEQEALNEYR
jgi:hypothetical protein